MLRVGFDGRDLLRKRTGVVNNAVYLARHLADRNDAEFIVYVDAHQEERAPDGVPIRRLASPADVWTRAQRSSRVRQRGRTSAATWARGGQAGSEDPEQAEAEQHGARAGAERREQARGQQHRERAGARRVALPAAVWKHVMLPMALLHDGVRVFHSPTGTLPIVAPCRQVVTIHDLFAVIEPRWFSPRHARQLQLTQRLAARNADAVIAVSQRTKCDLIQRFGVAEERIRVVYNGVDHVRFRPMEIDSDRVARRYGVRRPFVLCVGSLMPWRNGVRLLRAVARLGGDVGLLFVGRDIWGTDPTARVAAERGWEWARFAGYVADEDLAELYAAAEVLAYPSLYEGFGIPPLEAMACGTPVVASTAGALPEVLGDAALLVDPYDEDALAEAIRLVLQSPREWRERGVRHARRYAWERTAEETWRVYEEVAQA